MARQFIIGTESAGRRFKRLFALLMRTAGCAKISLISPLAAKPVHVLIRQSWYWLASLPEPPTRRCIIPCTDGWLELIDDQFHRVQPDRHIGITHSINVSIRDIPVGGVYQPKPNLNIGYFSRFLETSLPDKDVRFLIQQYAGYTLIPSAYLNLTFKLP